MKKNYIKPEVAIVEIETESLLAGSDITFTPDNNSGNGDLFDADATAPARSKGHSFNLWED